MEGKELLQMLIDMHEQISAEVDKEWNGAMDACVDNLSLDEFTRVVSAFRGNGQVLLIELIVEKMTSREDMQNIFGLENDGKD